MKIFSGLVFAVMVLQVHGQKKSTKKPTVVEYEYYEYEKTTSKPVKGGATEKPAAGAKPTVAVTTRPTVGAAPRTEMPTSTMAPVAPVNCLAMSKSECALSLVCVYNSVKKKCQPRPPTLMPTAKPTMPTNAPTPFPTDFPTKFPAQTKAPTQSPMWFSSTKSPNANGGCKKLGNKKACSAVETCMWDPKTGECVLLKDSTPAPSKSGEETSAPTKPEKTCDEMKFKGPCQENADCKWNNKKNECEFAVEPTKVPTSEALPCEEIVDRKTCEATTPCAWNKNTKKCSSPPTASPSPAPTEAFDCSDFASKKTCTVNPSCAWEPLTKKCLLITMSPTPPSPTVCCPKFKDRQDCANSNCGCSWNIRKKSCEPLPPTASPTTPAPTISCKSISKKPQCEKFPEDCMWRMKQCMHIYALTPTVAGQTFSPYSRKPTTSNPTKKPRTARPSASPTPPTMPTLKPTRKTKPPTLEA